MHIFKSAAALPALIGLAVGLFFNILVNLDTNNQAPTPVPTITQTVTNEKTVTRHDIPQVCVDALAEAAITKDYAEQRLKAYEQAMDALSDYSWYEATHAMKKFKKANTYLTATSSSFSINQAKCSVLTDMADG